MRKTNFFRLVIILALAAIIGIVLFALPTKEYLVGLLEWVQGLGPIGAFVLGAAFIPACLFFLPGSPITLTAGYLYGLWLGTIAVSIGSVLGASVAFLVGRTLARDWVEKKIARNPKFRAIDQAVEQQGFKIVLLVRLSPLFPFNLVNYMFGLTKVRFWDHFFASWMGMLPGTIMYVYFGRAARSLQDLLTGKIEGSTAQNIILFVGLAATIAVTLYVTRLAKRALDQAIPSENQPTVLEGA